VFVYAFVARTMSLLRQLTGCIGCVCCMLVLYCSIHVVYAANDKQPTSETVLSSSPSTVTSIPLRRY